MARASRRYPLARCMADRRRPRGAAGRGGARHAGEPLLEAAVRTVPAADLEWPAGERPRPGNLVPGLARTANPPARWQLLGVRHDDRHEPVARLEPLGAARRTDVGRPHGL